MAQLKSLLKITGSLLVSLLITLILANHFFSTYSPAIIPDLPAYYASQFNRLRTLSFLKQEKNSTTTAENVPFALLEKQLKTIAPGVRASEIGNSNLIEYTVDNVEYIEYEYILSSGKKVSIKVPKGVENAKPPQDMVERIYSNE